MMEKILTASLEYLKNEKRIVLATIIETHGSTPRKAGARMAVCEDGTCIGTIGGGTVEYKAILQAKKILEDMESNVVSCQYDLGTGVGEATKMTCGGSVTVEFRLLQKSSKSDIEWLQKEAEAEKNYSQSKVFVFGGGHVAKETVPVLVHLGFYVILQDDRVEFANKETFTDANEVKICDFSDEHLADNITKDDYVIIMTRGHQYDYEVVCKVLPRSPYYIGVMGSRHKVEFMTKALLEKGFTKEEIDRCHMPIGTKIFAETPAEIAISIAGELIACRNMQEASK